VPDGRERARTQFIIFAGATWLTNPAGGRRFVEGALAATNCDLRPKGKTFDDFDN
jgi:hypothetical protein